MSYCWYCNGWLIEKMYIMQTNTVHNIKLNMKPIDFMKRAVAQKCTILNLCVKYGTKSKVVPVSLLTRKPWQSQAMLQWKSK